MDEKNVNQTEPNTTQPEDNGAPGERKFTQEDVNRIVQDRLAKERSKTERTQHDQDEQAKKDLADRESRLACKEFILDNDYPKELLDCIDTSNPEEFKSKAEALYNAVKRSQKKAPPPAFSSEPASYSNPLGEAFGRGAKHKPKTY